MPATTSERAFTPKEAAALSGLSERRVRKEIEHRVLKGGEPPRLGFSALLYLAALGRIGTELPLELRRRMFLAIEEGGGSRSVAVADLLRLELEPVVDELREKVERFERWKRKLVSAPEIMGGETVFPGSRLTVRHVGEILERGESPEVLFEDYPELTDEDLEFAPLFVRAYPRVGRPPRRQVVD